MRVDDIKIPLPELVHQGRVKGHARAIADKLGGIQARIAQHREGKDGVVRIRVKGRDDRGRPVLACNDLCIIGDRISYAVDGRRERVVQQTHTQLFHGCLPYIRFKQLLL